MNLKRFFINSILSAILLGTVVLITTKPEGKNEQSKHFFNVTFKENLQFSKISKLIEKNYGSISAFLPTELQKSEGNYKPASGNVGPTFKEVDGGFIVDVANGGVISLTDGVVTFVSENNNGRVDVGMQLDDSSSVFYSGLASANVRIYQHVQKGELLGTTDVSGEYLLKASSSLGIFD